MNAPRHNSISDTSKNISKVATAAPYSDGDDASIHIQFDLL